MTLVFFVSEQCYLYKNEQGQNDIVTTLLPSSAAAGKYYEMFTRIILTFLVDRFYGLFELELRMGCVSIECCNVLANLTTKQKREVLSIILKKVQETLLLWLLVFLFVSEIAPLKMLGFIANVFVRLWLIVIFLISFFILPLTTPYFDFCFISSQ